MKTKHRDSGALRRGHHRSVKFVETPQHWLPNILRCSAIREQPAFINRLQPTEPIGSALNGAARPPPRRFFANANTGWIEKSLDRQPKSESNSTRKLPTSALARLGGCETEKGEEEMFDGYFGLCPTCKKTDGYMNIGSSHWFFCKKHRVRWCIGANLFSDWRDETEAEQRRYYTKIRFDTFREVQPFLPEIEGVKRLNEGGNAKPPVRGKKSTPGRRIQGKKS